MNNFENTNYSPVEQKALEHSPLQPIYAPEERIPVITVGNFPALGQLVAMRFVEWVQQNPGGVVSLPTGKTPEHFIKWVNRLISSWDEPETRQLLEQYHVDPGRKPDMGSLHFVQIDEFYPIQPTQKNSFYHYVKKFYLAGMGLDPKRALLMNCNEIGISPSESLDSVWPDSTVDLSLRTRQASTDLERTQQSVLARIDDWCQQREEQIRALGGIGLLSGRDRAGRAHWVQHPRIRPFLDHAPDGHQLRDPGGRSRRPGRHRSLASAAGDHHRVGHDHLQSRLRGHHHCSRRGQGRSDSGRGHRRLQRADPGQCLADAAERTLLHHPGCCQEAAPRQVMLMVQSRGLLERTG